jgi:hypothetical protein
MTEVASKYPNKLFVMKPSVVLDCAHVGGVDDCELYILKCVHAKYKAVVAEKFATATSEHS